MDSTPNQGSSNPDEDTACEPASPRAMPPATSSSVTAIDKMPEPWDAGLARVSANGMCLREVRTLRWHGTPHTSTPCAVRGCTAARGRAALMPLCACAARSSCKFDVEELLAEVMRPNLALAAYSVHSCEFASRTAAISAFDSKALSGDVSVQVQPTHWAAWSALHLVLRKLAGPCSQLVPLCIDMMPSLNTGETHTPVADAPAPTCAGGFTQALTSVAECLDLRSRRCSPCTWTIWALACGTPRALRPPSASRCRWRKRCANRRVLVGGCASIDSTR